MATTFSIRTKAEAGVTTIRARIQIPDQKIDLRVQTGIEVDIKKWNNSKESPTRMANFKKTEYGRKLWEILDSISLAIDVYAKENRITSDDMRRIIYDVTHREEIERERQRLEEEKRITLNKYIERFLMEIANGGRTTPQGKNYAVGSIAGFKVTLNKFKEFQKETGKTLDFEDIDMTFYREYTAYLKRFQYSGNYIGKCIKCLKAVLSCAEADGFEVNRCVKSQSFKVIKEEADTIYLTREDLAKLQKVKLKFLPPHYAKSLDIFMIGVWTAQRVSDYNNLTKDNIKVETVRSIAEDGTVTERTVRTIRITQIKTGKKVIIPCCKELCKILDKYPNELPKVTVQTLNKDIKEIAQLAKLKELVEITSTKGGNVVREKIPKYKLIHSHTARRTGATLMYLSGMNAYDICKITGHASIKMLHTYIKADELETVKKMTEEYDYFN